MKSSEIKIGGIYIFTVADKSNHSDEANAVSGQAVRVVGKAWLGNGFDVELFNGTFKGSNGEDCFVAIASELSDVPEL